MTTWQSSHSRSAILFRGMEYCAGSSQGRDEKRKKRLEKAADDKRERKLCRRYSGVPSTGLSNDPLWHIPQHMGCISTVCHQMGITVKMFKRPTSSEYFAIYGHSKPVLTIVEDGPISPPNVRVLDQDIPKKRFLFSCFWTGREQQFVVFLQPSSHGLRVFRAKDTTKMRAETLADFFRKFMPHSVRKSIADYSYDQERNVWSHNSRSSEDYCVCGSWHIDNNCAATTHNPSYVHFM